MKTISSLTSNALPTRSANETLHEFARRKRKTGAVCAVEFWAPVFDIVSPLPSSYQRDYEYYEAARTRISSSDAITESHALMARYLGVPSLPFPLYLALMDIFRDIVSARQTSEMDIVMCTVVGYVRLSFGAIESASIERVDIDVDSVDYDCVDVNYSYYSVASKIKAFLAEPDRLREYIGLPTLTAIECDNARIVMTEIFAATFGSEDNILLRNAFEFLVRTVKAVHTHGPKANLSCRPSSDYSD